ncbi:MAG: site-2 protease family protein, partial [Proteobacteria bacterium]|nr:site-2 protease family protein [Pseudomonadota bacterium]
MGELLGSIWWLIVSLGVLVTFHEYGHFWVARRCGVKVLRFSVGFGRPLWLRRGRHGTEYVIAAIPLGGYVKFQGDANVASLPVDSEAPGQPGDFHTSSVARRAAIVVAGPMANFVLAVVIFAASFAIVGTPVSPPVVEEVRPDSAA